MKTSQEGIELIKLYEGFNPCAYKLKREHKWTIGWGSTGKENECISEKEAEVRLKKSVQVCENLVNKKVTVALTQKQFNSLVSICYNVKNVLVDGYLLRELNNGDYSRIPDKLLEYRDRKTDNELGLARRRRGEAIMWSGGDTWSAPKKENWSLRKCLTLGEV